MRERLFRDLLGVLERYTPPAFRRLEIQILLDTTARGFGVPGRRIRSRRPAGALREYAFFTAACMQSGDGDPDRLRLEARRTGRTIRAITGFRRSADCSRLVFYLYKNIGISMSGVLPGEIMVTDCYFSRYYEPAQCALMSNVDAGIIEGICGDGSLEFSERITEGCAICRACFKKGGSDK